MTGYLRTSVRYSSKAETEPLPQAGEDKKVVTNTDMHEGVTSKEILILYYMSQFIFEKINTDVKPKNYQVTFVYNKCSSGKISGVSSSKHEMKGERTRQARMTAKPYDGAELKDTRIKILCAVCKKFKFNYQLIMENSTRDDSAVKSVNTSTNCAHKLNLTRLFKSSRSTTRAFRDSRRKVKTHSSIKVFYLKTEIRKSNYTQNYVIMVISTRDVFAVITAIKNMGPLDLSNTARLHKQERCMTRRSGEHKRTLQSCNSSLTNKQHCRKLGGNYDPNYPNVEISTRDLFAVITVITERIPIKAILGTANCCYISGLSKMLNADYVNEDRDNIHISEYVISEYRADKCKLPWEKGATYELYSVKRIVRTKLDSSNKAKWIRDEYTSTTNYTVSVRALPNLLNTLCYEFLARKYINLTDGTFYSKAKKYDRITVVGKIKGINGRSLSNTKVLCMNMGCTLMVNPNGMSFANKLPIRLVIPVITITTISDLKPVRVQCYTMSRQEIAKAVEQIQQAPPTSELAALQAFIEAQNATGILLVLFVSCSTSLWTNSLHLGQDTADPMPTISTTAIENLGQDTVDPMPTNSTTAIENPGYTTQSEMVIHEPVQYQYIYDPVNDIMKRVEKARDKPTDVGKGKQGKACSTGKTNSNKQEGLAYYRTNTVYYCVITGTESHVDTHPPASTSSTTESPVTAPCNAPDPPNTSQDNSTAHQESEVTATNEANHETDANSDQCSSQAFSSDSDTDEDNGKVQGEKNDKKDISSERHAKIDSRIMAQKKLYWKTGQKGSDDPRQGALIPIHAPKMERMNLAKMKALEARARLAQPPTDGDIVTPIIADIDNAAEINYSVVAVGAEFRTQNEVTKKLAQNGPNTVRPKAPTTKMRREDRVLPFPKRRIAAVQQEQATKQARKRKGNGTVSGTTPGKQRALSDSDTDSPVSDASWPTDQDESIATFRSKKGKRTPKPKTVAARKKTPKKAINRPKQQKKPQKKDIDTIIASLQTPLPRHTLTMNSALGEKETKDMIRKHAARIRSRRARVLKKNLQAKQISGPATVQQKDPLARAIDMARILECQEEDDIEIQPVPDTPNRELDRAIDNVLEALDTPSNSSRSTDSSSNSCSSSSSSSSDSEDWGTVKTVVRNPFAKQVTGSTPTSVVADTVGLDASADSDAEKSIKRKSTLKKVTVTIKKLTEKVIAKYQRPHEDILTPEVEPTMSAKNITKDRSTSRGRADKQDRFNKGRNDENGTETGGNGTGQGSSSQGGSGQGQGNNGGAKGQEIPSGKRPRDPPKTGMHDDTMGEDFEEEELPGAKRTMTSLREKLTHVYSQRTKETRDKCDEGRVKPSVEFRVDKTNAGEKVKTATVPLLAPTKLADAPTLSLKDLVPEADRQGIEEQGQDESFKTDRIEFVVVEREIAPGEEEIAMRPDELEWEFPERQMFDMIIGKAIDIYTEDDWDLIDYMSFSSVGWNTGVGLFAFGTDKLEQMEKFREVLRKLQIGNKRFESYPKRMLLNRYAITIYFNAAFAWSTVPKLLFWFRKLNGFDGNLTMAETRHYPDDHIPPVKDARSLHVRQTKSSSMNSIVIPKITLSASDMGGTCMSEVARGSIPMTLRQLGLGDRV